MKPTANLHGRFVGALLAGLLAVGQVAEAATSGPGPDVSISLRGIQNGTIEVGEPFQVAVRLDAPAESTGGILLAPASGTWIEATTVEMVAGESRVTPVVARVVSGGADRVTTVEGVLPKGALGTEKSRPGQVRVIILPSLATKPRRGSETEPRGRADWTLTGLSMARGPRPRARTKILTF